MNVSSGTSADYYKIDPEAKTIGDVVADKPPLIQDVWRLIFPSDKPIPGSMSTDQPLELIDLIMYFDLNAQEGEIARSCKRFGCDHHSSPRRDLEKIAYYLRQEYRRVYNLYPYDIPGIQLESKLSQMVELADRCDAAVRFMENRPPAPEVIGAAVGLVRPEWMNYGGPAFNL